MGRCSQSMDESYDRTLDIHSIPPTAYPPMSRWVLALTFLRSASRGVDAVSLLLYWVVALMEIDPTAAPCFNCRWFISSSV